MRSHQSLFSYTLHAYRQALSTETDDTPGWYVCCICTDDGVTAGGIASSRLCNSRMMPYHVAKGEQGGSLSPMELSLICQSAQR